MNRSKTQASIVLSLRPLGENNSSVTLLTETDGIVQAVLYGGAKSRLRSLVAQWNSGTAYFYENKEKNQIKISDFEVHKYHYSFGENLFKMYAASLAAELAIKTQCAGSNKECFVLESGFFDGMELSSEEQSRIALIRFLWRFLNLMGVQPESEACALCGRSFFSKEFALSEQCYYNEMENIFICNDCTVFEERLFRSTVEGARYLHSTAVLPAKESRQIKLSSQTFSSLREIVFFLIQKNCGQRLSTIETGAGIL